MLNNRYRLIENFIFAILITVFSVIIAAYNATSYGKGSAAHGGAYTENTEYVGVDVGNTPSVYMPVIIIDPGHGGADCGAVGVNGVLEKDINLSVSIKLADFFKDAGYNVKLTRTEDIMLTDSTAHSTKKESDLAARVRATEDGCIFISLHMNKFVMPEYYGLQVYYSENDQRSKKLANIIQQNIKSNLQPNNKREVKSGADLYLLKSINEICVLVECGFLSNAKEASDLADDKYQDALAYEIFSAVDDFVIETNYSY